MDHMSCLLPFAYSDAVQRVLLHPFVRGVIDVPGHYVYCLLSPLMRKVYVGAVGLKSARTPYARLREHLNLARLWNSKTSQSRYESRSPTLYRVMAKVGIEHVTMVILASVSMERLAVCVGRS